MLTDLVKRLGLIYIYIYIRSVKHTAWPRCTLHNMQRVRTSFLISINSVLTEGISQCLKLNKKETEK